MPQDQRLSVLLHRHRPRHSGRRSLAAAAADAMVEGLERKGGDGSRSPRACGSAVAREPILKGRADAVRQQVKPPGGAAAISSAKLPSRPNRVRNGLVWGFFCQAVVLGLLSVLCSEREGGSSSRRLAIRFAERAEGVKGPKR